MDSRIASGQLRVFISSTFNDMNAERDALNAIFPQIKEKCKKRGIDFVPIDLRWGVTEEAAKQGRVIDTCMREIDNSRPFFIGLVGHRYGWIPTSEDMGIHYDSLRVQYPWLEKAVAERKSITEMEMLYAALDKKNDAGQHMDAAFFLRKNEVQVPPEFKEADGSEGARKLRSLRDKISGQQRYGVALYGTPDELAQQVKKALEDFIDKEYPEADTKSYDIDVRNQERILKSRFKSLFELGRYQQAYDQWYNGDSRWLLINGWSGRGKSYLAAKYVQQLRARNKGENVVVYADCASFSDGDSMVEYVLTEILHNLGVRTRHQSERSQMWGCLGNILLFFIKLPYLLLKILFLAAFRSDKAAGDAFAKGLGDSVDSMSMATLKSLGEKTYKALNKPGVRPVYVIWDNLDAMDVKEMPFFHDFIDSVSIRNIITARTDTDVELYVRNVLKATILGVGNMTDVQASQYVVNYLNTFGKQLDAAKGQYEKIVRSKVAGVPMLLKQVLDLLVNFGSHEQLDDYLTELAGVENVKQVYELSIRNITKIFPGEQGGELAVDVLTALSVVPDGLREEEIKDIFQPTPMVWAGISPYLLNICRVIHGAWRIDNSEMVAAVFSMVPKGRADKTVSKIAKYFESKLKIRLTHKMKLGNGIDGGQIVDDNYTFMRQARVLMQLFYATGDAENLYYWITYLSTWHVLSERQAMDYWRLLYSKGYTMRASEGPDVYPLEKRKIMRICMVDVKNGRFKSINPVYRKAIDDAQNRKDIVKMGEEDKNRIYLRWLGVASNLGNSEDMAWLQNSVLKIDGEFGNQQVTREAQLLNRLIQEKRYDEIISRIGTVTTDDAVMDASLCSFYALSYLNKGQGAEALKYSKRMIADLEKDGIKMAKECMTYIATHVVVITVFNDKEEIDAMTPLVEAQYEYSVNEGLNQMATLYGAQSMTFIMRARGEKQRALDAARTWLACAKTLNVDPTNAQTMVNQLTNGKT